MKTPDNRSAAAVSADGQSKATSDATDLELELSKGLWNRIHSWEALYDSQPLHEDDEGLLAQLMERAESGIDALPPHRREAQRILLAADFVKHARHCRPVIYSRAGLLAFRVRRVLRSRLTKGFIFATCVLHAALALIDDPICDCETGTPESVSCKDPSQVYATRLTHATMLDYFVTVVYALEAVSLLLLICPPRLFSGTSAPGKVQPEERLPLLPESPMRRTYALTTNRRLRRFIRAHMWETLRVLYVAIRIVFNVLCATSLVSIPMKRSLVWGLRSVAPSIFLSRGRHLQFMAEGVGIALWRQRWFAFFVAAVITMFAFVSFVALMPTGEDCADCKEFQNFGESCVYYLRLFTSPPELTTATENYSAASPVAAPLFEVTFMVSVCSLLGALLVAISNRAFRLHTEFVYEKRMSRRRIGVSAAFRLLQNSPEGVSLRTWVQLASRKRFTGERWPCGLGIRIFDVVKLDLRSRQAAMEGVGADAELEEEAPPEKPILTRYGSFRHAGMIRTTRSHPASKASKAPSGLPGGLADWSIHADMFNDVHGSNVSATESSFATLVTHLMAGELESSSSARAAQHKLDCERLFSDAADEEYADEKMFLGLVSVLNSRHDIYTNARGQEASEEDIRMDEELHWRLDGGGRKPCPAESRAGDDDIWKDSVVDIPRKAWKLSVRPYIRRNRCLNWARETGTLLAVSVRELFDCQVRVPFSDVYFSPLSMFFDIAVCVSLVTSYYITLAKGYDQQDCFMEAPTYSGPHYNVPLACLAYTVSDILIIVFWLEVFLYVVYFKGFVRYLNADAPFHFIDFLVVCASTIFSLSHISGEHGNVGRAIIALRSLRVFRFLQNFRDIEPVKSMASLLATLPLLLRLFFVQFCVLYAFSVVAHILYCDKLWPEMDLTSPFPQSTASAWRKFSDTLSFDTFASSLYTMFALQRISGWTMVMDATRLNVQGKGARILSDFFFYLFRLLNTMLLTPALIGFVVQAFMSGIAQKAAREAKEQAARDTDESSSSATSLQKSASVSSIGVEDHPAMSTTTSVDAAQAGDHLLEVLSEEKEHSARGLWKGLRQVVKRNPAALNRARSAFGAVLEHEEGDEIPDVSDQGGWRSHSLPANRVRSDDGSAAESKTSN